MVVRSPRLCFAIAVTFNDDKAVACDERSASSDDQLVSPFRVDSVEAGQLRCACHRKYGGRTVEGFDLGLVTSRADIVVPIVLAGMYCVDVIYWVLLSV